MHKETQKEDELSPQMDFGDDQKLLFFSDTTKLSYHWSSNGRSYGQTPAQTLIQFTAKIRRAKLIVQRVVMIK